MIMKKSPILKSKTLMVLFLITGTLAVMACRYSVRDVGFVDLVDEPYQLCLHSEKAREAGLESALEKAGLVILEDSNVQWKWDGYPENANSNSFAVLVSPEGAMTELTLPEGKDAADVSWRFFEQTITSPLRKKIRDRIAMAFCVVLFLPSADGNDNQRVIDDIDASIQSIAEIIPFMPKPVDHPPERIQVEMDQLEEEKTLLWSLGFDLSDQRQAQAAVLYGRGRRIGPVLAGGVITKTRLTEIMTIVGQDCECELDRAWMRGPTFPAVYGSSWQSEVYQHLGFDTENPMVKTEISRILSRGPNAEAPTEKRAGSYEQYQLGYAEEIIGDEDSLSDSAIASELDALLAEAEEAIQNAEKEQADSGAETSAVSEWQVSTNTTSVARENLDNDEHVDEEGKPLKLSLWVFTGILILTLGGGGWILMQANRNA